MKKKGFTLIELLAVIVILAIIALIAVPGILNIIYKAKLAAAEDSTLGVVSSTDQYIGNFVMKNDGSFPSGGLVFVCVNDKCDLETSSLDEDYEINGLMQLKFQNLKPTGGKVIIDSDGKTITVEDLIVGEFVCNYPVDGTASCVDKGSRDKEKPLVEPTFILNPKGWSQSKEAKVTFKGVGTNLIRTTTEVTIDIEAIGCEVYKQTTICNGEKISRGGTLQANKWYKVNSNPTLTYITSGSLNYEVTNGVSYIEGGALTITEIDRTPPALTVSTSVTTNSITVTASGIDNESGISGYQFSKDGGTTWLPTTPQESNVYTFNGLTSGNYNIKVRAINGTYENNGQNNLNMTESEVKRVATTELKTPTGRVNQSGWSQSKTTTINFTGEGTYLLRPSVTVTTNVAAVACSNVNNGVFTCNGASVAANGTLQANTWYKVTSNPTLTFTSNGSISIKVADGVNYKDGSATTVAYIDRTAPTASSFTTSVTTNSIKVTATGTDNESGISKYQFSIDNGAWQPTTPQTSNSYTFSSLKSGNHSIKVRVINGTYGNNGQNTMNTTESAAKTVATTSLNTPTGRVNQSGWTQSKTATITYSGSGTYLLRPSVAVTTNIAATTCSSVSNGSFTCNGANVAANGTLQANTWYRVTSNPTLTFTSNGSVSIKIADGVNYKDGSATTVSYIDRTAPTAATVASTSVTTNSITVTASGTDAESGISRYQFSKDNGATWLPATPQTSNSYTFSGVTSGSYNVKVRVINGTYPNINQINTMNSTVSTVKSVTTTSLNTPAGKVNQSGWTQSKTATITYSGSGTYLLRPSVAVTTNIAATTCSSVSNGAFTCNGANVAANGTLAANTWYKVTGNPTLTFTSNGSVSIKIADGVNYKDGSATTVSYIDRTAPTVANVTKKSTTTNSITVTASGTDSESGISRYQFSIDNGAWQPSTPQTSNEYTFTGVTSGNHQIKSRVINGTYPNINQINTMNSKESSNITMAPGTLATPTGRVNQSGWTQSKTVTITYSGSGTYLLRPSVAVTTNIAATKCSSVSNGAFTCNGGNVGAGGTLTANTWYKVTSNPTLTFISNGSVSIKIADGVNYKDGSATTVTQIDRTKPTIKSFTATSTSSSSVNLTVTATDPESGIASYEFYVTRNGTETMLTGCSGNTCTYNFSGPYASKDYTNANVSYRVKVYNNVSLSSETSYSDTCTTSSNTTTCKSGISYTVTVPSGSTDNPCGSGGGISEPVWCKNGHYENKWYCNDGTVKTPNCAGGYLS